MNTKTYVVGVGMTRFEKPGRRDWDYTDMAKESGTLALADAGLSYDDAEQVAVGYCYGDSTTGHRAAYELGLSGVPLAAVNSNCSTGSAALFLARQWIQGGLVDCALALGFEKMHRGSLKSHWDDREQPLTRFFEEMGQRWEFERAAPPSPQLFGNAGREYMERYGVSTETMARVAEKNHRHSTGNPYAQFQTEYSLEEILASPMIYDPLTKLQCCPTSDGAACAVVASERFVDEHGLRDRAVEVAGMAMRTDTPATFDGSDLHLVGSEMTRAAALAAYQESGLGPEDVQVIELHDCFSANELITYDGLGLCAEGGAGELVDSGAVTYGGRWVVNPSGGLISKGHPLGATGLAQCAELTWQLRGEAEARQVQGARAALQHNLGLGGAAVVAVYRAPVATEPSV